MTRYFTTYWTKGPWERLAYETVHHAASNEFAKRGVQVGDHLYVVHYEAREVFVGARLVVGRIMTRAEAAAAFGVEEDEVWDARDHVLANPDYVQRLDPNRVVPRDVLMGLSFLRADGTETGLKFNPDGAADQQTLRTVRELSPSSAEALNALIGWESAPRASQVLTIRLSRGPCQGTCPVYMLWLRADGIAGWHGEAFVDRVGAHLGGFSPRVFSGLADLAVTGGFFTLEEEYPPPGTDLPSCEIAVETGLRDKVVRAWGSAEPEPFRELAERLDEIANGIDWYPL
jgi:hypothetical protein